MKIELYHYNCSNKIKIILTPETTRDERLMHLVTYRYKKNWNFIGAVLSWIADGKEVFAKIQDAKSK